MADKRDYYEVLGIPRTAAHAEIESAFKQLISITSGVDLREIAEAFLSLSQKDKRKDYDEFIDMGNALGVFFGQSKQKKQKKQKKLKSKNRQRHG